MTISFYEASVTPISRAISNLRSILQQGKKYAEQQGIAEEEVLAMKLYDDMFDLKTQIQTIYFLAINQGVMLVAGLAPGKINPSPSSWTDLDDNLAVMESDLAKVDVESYNSKVDNKVECTLPMGTAHFETAQIHMAQWVLPHTYFHTTTAYDILRNAGVPLTKSHFLGPIEIRIEAP